MACVFFSQFETLGHKYKVKALPQSLFLRQYDAVLNTYSSSFIYFSSYWTLIYDNPAE